MFELIKILQKVAKLLPGLRRLLLRKVRQSIRGYHMLRKKNLLHIPAELKSKLEATRVLPAGGRLSTDIFGPIAVDHDLIVRQFLLSRYICIYSRFNHFLLSSIGSANNRFYFPLPLSWREVLSSANIPAETRLNSLLWGIEVFVHWVGALIRILRIFIQSLGALMSQSRWPSDYALFSGISEEMLPDKKNPLLERNVINWYAAWEGRAPSVTTLACTAATKREIKVPGIKIVPIKIDLPTLPSYSALAKFFLWGVSSSILSFGRLVTGKWWDALLLSEAAKAAVVRYNPKERLAREYFFMFDWTYRPIWTYLAESMGSKIYFFFYSTNSEQFKTKSGYIPLLFDWRSINWPNYVVWDQYQEDFIARHSGAEARFHIAGPLHLSGKVPVEIDFKKKSLAVFDVMPMRLSIYATLGLSKEYFVAKTCIDFVQDIIDTASELNCHVYLKTKRVVSKRVDASYQRLLDSLHNRDNVTVLSGDYPAETLIRKTAMSVSMPWTSTALIANYFAKPACYYDSTETLLHDDRGAHGVPVCVGKEELRQYLSTLLEETADKGIINHGFR